MCSNTVSPNYMASSFETHQREVWLGNTIIGVIAFVPKQELNFGRNLVHNWQCQLVCQLAPSDFLKL